MGLFLRGIVESNRSSSFHPCAPMKKLLITSIVTVAWIALLALQLKTTLDDDPIGFYSRRPHVLLAVIAAAVGIALTLQAYLRLSPGIRRGLSALFWGAAAAAGTLVFAGMALFVIRHAPTIGHDLGWSHVLVMLAMLCGFSWFSAMRCLSLLRACRNATTV
jgi:hypothetical protein